MSDAGLRDALLLVERFLTEPTSESLFRKSARVLAQALDEEERFTAPSPSMWRKLRNVLGGELDSALVTAWGEGKRYPRDPAAMMARMAEVLRKHGVVTHANQARERATQQEPISFGQVATTVGVRPVSSTTPSLAERMHGVPLLPLLERLGQWGHGLSTPGAFAMLCAELCAVLPEDGVDRCMVPLGGRAAHVALWGQGASPPDLATQRRVLQQFMAFCLLLLLNEPTTDQGQFLVRMRWTGALVQNPGMVEAVVRLNGFTQGRWGQVTPEMLAAWAHAPVPPALPVELLVPLQHAFIEVLKARFHGGTWPP
ncbi:MAG: hypothetical protein AB2A00_25495 [Myxococcota bacterium]